MATSSWKRRARGLANELRRRLGCPAKARGEDSCSRGLPIGASVTPGTVCTKGLERQCWYDEADIAQPRVLEADSGLCEDYDEARGAEAQPAGALRERSATADAGGTLSQRIAAVVRDGDATDDAEHYGEVAGSTLSRWQAMAEELEAAQSALPPDPAPGDSAAEKLVPALMHYWHPDVCLLQDLARKAVADQQLLRERIAELETAVKSVGNYAHDLEGQRTTAKTRVAELEAALSEANAALAEHPDAKLLDAVELITPGLNIGEANFAGEDPVAKLEIETPVKPGARLDKIPDHLRDALAALVGMEPGPRVRALVGQPAQEPQEHPDTRRMRTLSAVLEKPGAHIQRTADDSLIGGVRAGFYDAFAPTLVDLADALPDPDAPPQPERTLDAKLAAHEERMAAEAAQEPGEDEA